MYTRTGAFTLTGSGGLIVAGQHVAMMQVVLIGLAAMILSVMAFRAFNRKNKYVAK